MGIFGASTLTLIGVVWWVTNGYLEQQTNATIEAEVTGLVEQYRQRGIQGLESLIAERQTMSNGVPTVYLFADQQRKNWRATCQHGLRARRTVPAGTTFSGKRAAISLSPCEAGFSC